MMRPHKDAVRSPEIEAVKRLRSGNTGTGVRSRSRYGVKPGAIYITRAPGANTVKIMRYPEISRAYQRFTRLAQLGTVRYFPWKWTVPDLRGTTRAHIDVTQTSKFRKPQRVHPTKGFRTPNARVTPVYVGREYPKYARKYPRRPGRSNTGIFAQGLRFGNVRVVHTGHRIYYRFLDSRRYPGAIAESQYPPYSKQTWMHRYARGKFTTKVV